MICCLTKLSCLQGLDFPTEELKEEGYRLGHNLASQHYNLLSNILVGVHNDSDELKDEILDISRKIAHSTAEMTKLAEKVAGEDLVDPEDPMLIAEKELFNAAESIELAAKRLAALRPRQEVEESNRVISIIKHFKLTSTCLEP